MHRGKHAGPSKLKRNLKLALIPVAGAMAIGPIVVHPGDTLSGIAANAGVSLSSVEAANPQISNPNLIYVGQKIRLPGGGSSGMTTVPGAVHRSSSQSSSVVASSDLADVPGVPHAFAACVAFRESSNNPRSVNAVPGFIGNGGGAYGIMAYVWQGSDLGFSGQPYDAPLSQQKQAFSILYAKYGSQPWSPSDGC